MTIKRRRAAEQAVRAAIMRKFGPRDFLTLGETAALFETTEVATWAGARRGHLPTINVNGRRRVPVDLLVAQVIGDGERDHVDGDDAA